MFPSGMVTNPTQKKEIQFVSPDGAASKDLDAGDRGSLESVKSRITTL